MEDEGVRVKDGGCRMKGEGYKSFDEEVFSCEASSTFCNLTPSLPPPSQLALS